MTSKKQLQLAYGLAVVLFLVGIISYSAFSAKQPETPIRLMFQSAAGGVLFSHQAHTADAGYGIACKDCHHHPEEDDVDLRACGECHRLPEKGEPAPKACSDCHEPDEVEDTEMMKRSDAFHSQCIECHKDIEAGPQACGSCHFMK